MTTDTTAKNSSGAAISGGTDYTFTVPAFSVPDGCTIKRFKVSLSISNSNLVTRAISSGTTAPAKDTWYTYSSTNAKMIGWTDGSTSKVKIHNNSSGSLSCAAIITFEYTLDKVVKGNKIMNYDRSKAGKSANQGAVMKDTNFMIGDIITASAFNSEYLS